ncbi:4Fe-4S binding protein [candidate division KSB1 bacterium]|nr:4Fe-4S binding protein [candidate division KSB1 bacterium]
MLNIIHEICDLCGTCVSVCPFDALELFENRLKLKEENCTQCLLCLNVCPLHAIEEDSE